MFFVHQYFLYSLFGDPIYDVLLLWWPRWWFSMQTASDSRPKDRGDFARGARVVGSARHSIKAWTPRGYINLGVDVWCRTFSQHEWARVKFQNDK